MQKFWSFYSSLAHTLHWTKGIQTPALVQGLGARSPELLHHLSYDTDAKVLNIPGVGCGKEEPSQPLKIQEALWQGRSSLVPLLIPVPVCFCSEGRYQVSCWYIFVQIQKSYSSLPFSTPMGDQAGLGGSQVPPGTFLSIATCALCSRLSLSHVWENSWLHFPHCII